MKSFFDQIHSATKSEHFFFAPPTMKRRKNDPKPLKRRSEQAVALPGSLLWNVTFFKLSPIFFFSLKNSCQNNFCEITGQNFWQREQNIKCLSTSTDANNSEKTCGYENLAATTMVAPFAFWTPTCVPSHFPELAKVEVDTCDELHRNQLEMEKPAPNDLNWSVTSKAKIKKSLSIKALIIEQLSFCDQAPKRSKTNT